MRFGRRKPGDGIKWDMVHRPRAPDLPRTEGAPAIFAMPTTATTNSATKTRKPLNKLRKSRGSAHLRGEIDRTTNYSAGEFKEPATTTAASGVYHRDGPTSSPASTSPSARLPREYSSLVLTSLVSGSAESVEDGAPLVSLEMIDECQEISQEQETHYTYYVHSRDHTFSTVDTSVLDPGGEGGLEEGSSVDTVTWDRDRTPQPSVQVGQRAESRDNKGSRRKMVILNGDLEGEQQDSMIEVQPAMEQFCNFSKPLGKGNSVHQGDKGSGRRLTRSDLSALEKLYVPHYHLQDAVPEQRREQRRNSMWGDISRPSHRQDQQAPSVSMAGSVQQEGVHSDRSSSLKPSTGSTDYSKPSRSSHTRRWSTFSSRVASRADDTGGSRGQQSTSRFGKGTYFERLSRRQY